MHCLWNFDAVFGEAAEEWADTSWKDGPYEHSKSVVVGIEQAEEWEGGTWGGSQDTT